MVQGVYGKRRLLLRFKDKCEKDLTSNQLLYMTVEKITVNEKPEVTNIFVIPDNTVDSEKGLYHCAYDM